MWFEWFVSLAAFWGGVVVVIGAIIIIQDKRR